MSRTVQPEDRLAETVTFRVKTRTFDGLCAIAKEQRCGIRDVLRALADAAAARRINVPINRHADIESGNLST